MGLHKADDLPTSNLRYGPITYLAQHVPFHLILTLGWVMPGGERRSPQFPISVPCVSNDGKARSIRRSPVGVSTSPDPLSYLLGPPPHFGEGAVRRPAEAQVATAPIDRDAQFPPPSAALFNPKGQAVPVQVTAGRQRCDLARSQPVRSLCHLPSNPPLTPPTSNDLSPPGEPSWHSHSAIKGPRG